MADDVTHAVLHVSSSARDVRVWRGSGVGMFLLNVDVASSVHSGRADLACLSPPPEAPAS
eukprot:2593510-Alexandrium_andersonii.AAC.1